MPEAGVLDEVEAVVVYDEPWFVDNDEYVDDIEIDHCSDPLCCPQAGRAVPATDVDNMVRARRELLEREVRLRTFDASIINATPSSRWWDSQVTFTPIPNEERMPEANTVTDLDVRFLTPSLPGYGQHLRASFQFFRRNAQNRYSSATLMRLANAAGEFDDRTRQGTEHSPRTSALLPVITVAERPQSYDEETEVKSGGVVGMMVTWPDGKALFAVVSGSRRQGIGRRIFTHNANYTATTPYFWVATTNVPAQQFLLAMGLAPTALNGNGAVRYGYSGGEE